MRMDYVLPLRLLVCCSWALSAQVNRWTNTVPSSTYTRTAFELPQRLLVCCPLPLRLLVCWSWGLSSHINRWTNTQTGYMYMRTAFELPLRLLVCCPQFLYNRKESSQQEFKLWLHRSWCMFLALSLCMGTCTSKMRAWREQHWSSERELRCWSRVLCEMYAGWNPPCRFSNSSQPMRNMRPWVLL